MPEGHKTHFYAREHTGWFSGQPLRVTSPQGRFRRDARKVSGIVFDHCEAVGKHLFYHFENDRMIHVHLGRYGKYRAHDAPPPPAVGLVRMRLVGPAKTLDLNGPTTCRVIDRQTREEVVGKLGPDPLAGGSSARKKAMVWEKIRSSKKPIGALLLDQSVIAGVGNIFRAELFFETLLDPRTAGTAIDEVTFDVLWQSLIKMMRKGLKYGKIVTVTAKEAGAPLSKLEGRDRFRVYGKATCPRCQHSIETIEIAARNLYWCPRCQANTTVG
ncbi:Endonuclease 8 1 [Stieleria maiorica]|uniref:DNA-(apurinic or apyrimidinic site) lyase n=1 Tax=Stieleria maiorica TaxID=2795974 RepID=A0A5B9MLW6_9BACT|nr:zinc finger domain-containing protein [Stieleria maiorica]QEG00506.1 Endonuclease 8 1 [Stieleria maiorica]